MNKKSISRWCIAAGVRAVKTAAQSAVALIPAGVCITEVTWPVVIGTACLAGVVSILTSIAGVPEVDEGASPLKGA